MVESFFQKIDLEQIHHETTYCPTEKKITKRDIQCIEVLKEILLRYPDTKERQIRKSLLEIIKQEQYQILYYDGHTSEFTAYLYNTIRRNVDIVPDTLEFNLFLFDLIHWCSEYFRYLDEEK